MAGFGGYGREILGAGPYGVGGFLHVMRAAAISGRVVRVVFDEEPVHQSPIGLYDALNPNNYQFSVVAGQASAPHPLGVKKEIVEGPTLLVNAGDERGVDVQVDRSLVIGITYRVRAIGVRAAAGGTLGSPFEADFDGRVPLKQTRPTVRGASFVDLDANPGRGTWRASPGGDLINRGGEASYKKRILRRATTPKGGFSWLPNYGTRVRPKQPFSIQNVADIKTDLEAQILDEPETAEASVQATITGGVLVILQIRARSRAGIVVEAGALVQQDGSIVIS